MRRWLLIKAPNIYIGALTGVFAGLASNNFVPWWTPIAAFMALFIATMLGRMAVQIENEEKEEL